MASLGFTDEKVPIGAHICQIFSNHNERIDALLKFLLSGLQAGERTTCFSDMIDEETLRKFFSSQNISYDERKQNKAIALAGTKEVYFQENVFDPDRMLNTLSTYHQESLDLGFPAVRVIGEMMPEIRGISGGDRLFEYESRLTMLLRDNPVTTLCQYDANVFSGAAIMDVLKVHPLIIVKGQLVHNPFCLLSDDFLKAH